MFNLDAFDKALRQQQKACDDLQAYIAVYQADSERRSKEFAEVIQKTTEAIDKAVEFYGGKP
jgi:hypothetical protein